MLSEAHRIHFPEKMSGLQRHKSHTASAGGGGLVSGRGLACAVTVRSSQYGDSDRILCHIW